MAKTRSQGLSLVAKKEEHEDKIKLAQLLRGTNNASKTKSKITKNRKPIQAQNVEVKSKNDDDKKALLASPKRKSFTRSKITAEQISKLIGYIVNDKMNVTAAARKVGISQTSAQSYYHEYKDDPERKIPLRKTGFNKRPSTVTEQKIEELIHRIVHDGMNTSQAAKKVDVSRYTATRYYAKYLEDPERKTPLLNVRTSYSFKRYAQEQVTDLIGYIVCDKMSVVEASKKASMSRQAARRYYLKYLYNPNHEIPDPRASRHLKAPRYSSDQVSSLIKYVVNDGMSVVEASIKANISIFSANRYYKQYLNDPENKIPTPETNNIRKSSIRFTPDQVKNFFCYIIVDKLDVAQASLKANISQSTGSYYYKKYIENSIQGTNVKDMTYSVEKMKQLIEFVQNKKMSLAKAADAVHLDRGSACKLYQQYMKNPQYEFPENKYKHYTHEDVRKLIGYIERDKMSLKLAAREINMDTSAAYRYYKEYQNDPEHKIPVPMIRGHTRKNKTMDKYEQIISEIYKNNPSIKRVHGNHDVLNINIKEESVEEDTKMALKRGK